MCFSIALLGSRGCGKTTAITRISSGEFLRDHRPSRQFEVHNVRFHTNYGVFQINVIESNPELPGDAITGVDGAIVMYDVKRIDSYAAVEDLVLRINPTLPIAVVGTKVDLQRGQGTRNPNRMIAPRIGAIQNYEISSKSNYNYEKPWLWMLQKISGLADLQFVEAPPVAPYEINYTEAMAAAM